VGACAANADEFFHEVWGSLLDKRGSLAGFE
jgi:hypothetical protein